MSYQEAYEELKSLFENTENICDFPQDRLSEEDCKDITIDELSEMVDRWISETCDIIYYSRAMEFLSKYDPSLHEACEAASEMGYATEDLNSEILATCLNYRYMYNDWSDIYSEAEDIISQIDDDEDEEEIEGVGYLNVYEPIPSDAKSFYGKAIVIDDGSGKLQLKSYNTIVAVYNKRTKTLTVNGWYSATTARHIRAFAAQLGISLPAGTKIAGKYKA